MILCTIKKKSEYTNDFIQSLQQQIKLKFIIQADKKILKQLENQIRAIYPISTSFNLYEICINSIDKSLILEDDLKFQIIIDPNLRIQNIRIELLFQVINDGNLNIPAYPIFSTIQKEIENNIENYFRLYQFGIKL